MRKRSVLACIEPQLLTDRPTGAACARTGCNNIVFDTGSLRGKVGVLVPRSPSGARLPESRTRRRLPHLIARQFSNLQVRHVSLRSREGSESKCQVKKFLSQVVHACAQKCRLAPFRIVARPLYNEIPSRNRSPISIRDIERSPRYLFHLRISLIIMRAWSISR